jgi:hypothetical protein
MFLQFNKQNTELTIDQQEKKTEKESTYNKQLE